MTILTGKDHAESLLMVETGRAAAFFEDDILLTGLAANSRDPAAGRSVTRPTASILMH